MRGITTAPATTELVTGGSGGEYLRRSGVGHIDAKWTDDNDHSWSTRRKVARMLARRADSIDLVIVDELFYVPALCVEMELPCLFMACTFATSRYFRFIRGAIGQSQMRFAVPDWYSLHPTPPEIAPHVDFLGPLVAVETCTRLQARAALGLPADATITVLLHGSPHTSKGAIRLRMLQEAVDHWRTGSRSDSLLVVVGEKPANWSDATSAGEVKWILFTNHTRLLAKAADLVLACAGTVALESLRAGTPTIAYTSRADWLAHARMNYLAGLNVAVHRCVDDDVDRAFADDVAASNDLRDVNDLGLSWADPSKIAALAIGLVR
ncbi:hypothetical protein [Actinosynnema sp. ALI-1.44]|uniref:hypothetical protein n=1 Tax=Actinosynnema sp. ALI-1.44 TaxID=1933779 RepID=UPI001177A612|nr:hypothetical protein [Actinosynnema sp. ALI-1.44]